MILGDVNNALSPTVISQKLNREIIKLADTEGQMDLAVTQTQENISSSQNSITLSPKLTTYWNTEPVSADTGKLI